eukprot:354498-Chlamydomonas_euryale.AAC.7
MPIDAWYGMRTRACELVPDFATCMLPSHVLACQACRASLMHAPVFAMVYGMSAVRTIPSPKSRLAPASSSSPPAAEANVALRAACAWFLPMLAAGADAARADALRARARGRRRGSAGGRPAQKPLSRRPRSTARAADDALSAARRSLAAGPDALADALARGVAFGPAGALPETRLRVKRVESLHSETVSIEIGRGKRCSLPSHALCRAQPILVQLPLET